MSVDNPAYFYTNDSPKSPEITSKKFTFFRRRSSSNHKLISNKSGNYIQTFESSSQRKSNKNKLFDSDSEVTVRKTPINEPFSAEQDSCVYGKFRQRLGSCNDSVFYSDKSECTKPLNRSYNSKSNSTSSDGRRHSIGTFLQKDRLRSGSFSDEVPKIPAPKVPSARVLNYKCATSMDDILIVTSKQSETGLLWVSHLKTCFNNITKQRGRQSFNFLHINVDDGITSMEEVQRCLAMKLQIIIICPKLASLPTSLLKSRLSEIIKPEIAIGMFLDSNDKNKTEMETCKNALPNFKKWRKFIIKNDNQTAISKLIGIAIDILGRALRDQPVTTSIHTNTVATKNQLDNFTIFPKKVNFGHNKLAVFLVEPLQKDDLIRVKIEKSGDIFEIPNIKRRNPFTLQLTIPESYLEMSSMILIKVEKNGCEIGVRPLKCESRLRELEQILKYDQSPIDMLCQSVGIQKTDRVQLDLCLVKCFQKNIPPHFNLLDSQNLISSKYRKRTEEYPTLLHFAACYGLEHLCLQLLECPGGSVVGEIQNCNGKTAANLAEESGHLKISTTLKNYSQMSELATMYQYFKGVSAEDTQEKTCIIQEETPMESSLLSVINDQTTTDYMPMIGKEKVCKEIVDLNYANIASCSNSDILSNELKIVEPTYFDSEEGNKNDEFSLECSNRLEDFHSAILNEPSSDYLIQPSNIPVPQYSTKENAYSDYLINPSNLPYTATNNSITNTYSSIDMSETFMKLNFNKKNTNCVSTSNIVDPKLTNSNCLKRQLSDSSSSRVDDELLEIINDFKNNVFTIQEVENLVSSWKTRNDVQQSYKEKQEQLQNMRKEYERIQNEMKEKLKRPTPFDRMKKIFTRRKSIRRDVDSDKLCSKTSTSSTETQRPASSLSVHSVSSVSSGRLSTSSSASLGDSGTHSDNDERKQIFNTSLRISTSSNPMDNYLIPPTPRRVITPETTPLEEKDMLNFDSNYCIFPSNIPVTTNLVSHDYMNFPGLNTITEAKEISLESDLVSLQPIKISKSDNLCNNTSQFFNPCTSFKCAVPKSNEVGYTKDEL